MNIDITACFTYAIEKVKENPPFYFLGFFLILGIGVAIKLLAQGTAFMFNLVVLQSILGIGRKTATVHEHIAAIIIGIVLSFFLAPFLVGYFRGLRKEYEAQKAEPLDVLLGVDVMTQSVTNYATALFLVLGGFILLIIPGLILSPIIPLTIFFLAKGETQGIDALRKAIVILKENPLLILWNLAFLILASAATALLFIKVIFALILFPVILVAGTIFTCATYMLFEQLSAKTSVKMVDNYRNL